MDSYDFYGNFWHRACAVTAEMEANGCYFDVERCRGAAKLAVADQQALGAAWESAAPGVNPESPKQLQEFLYATKKFPVPPVAGTLKAVKRTKRGERPTGEASLDWLFRKSQRDENRALLRCLLDIRKVTKLAQFLAKLPDYVDASGYLRAGFGPDTGTGRLSSRNPNLQNLPGAANDKYGIRACFTAPPGMRLLVADYAALEPRVLAHWLIALFGDHSLAEALAAGDMYGAVAKTTWPDKLQGIEPHEIKDHSDPEIKKLRGYAKVVVLGTNYGKTASGMAVQLGISTEEAAELLAAYFRAYPGIRRIQKWAYEQLGVGGVRTLLGRTRSIPRGATDGERARAERQATNTIVQGSAADVVFGAMIKQQNLGGTLQLQVHDELVWRIPTGMDTRLLLHAMEHPFKVDLLVPLPVEAKVVTNWSEAK